MEQEIWKDVVGYEGLYQVSSIGNIRNKKRLIKQRIHKDGYYMVNLSKNGKSKSFRTNRLVAIAFIPNPLNKPQTNHIDGNKLNNCVSNLEWVSAKENISHAIKIGLMNPKAKRKPFIRRKSPNGYRKKTKNDPKKKKLSKKVKKINKIKLKKRCIKPKVKKKKSKIKREIKYEPLAVVSVATGLIVRQYENKDIATTKCKHKFVAPNYFFSLPENKQKEFPYRWEYL